MLEQRTVVSVMIETPPQAVRACDDIAAVGGIDMILIGPSDLTARWESTASMRMNISILR